MNEWSAKLRRIRALTVKESRQITVFNGKPVKGEQPHLVYDFTDDFADFANAFFSAKHRRCYNFALGPRAAGNGPLQVNVSVSPAAAGVADCVFTLAQPLSTMFSNSRS